MVQVGCGVSGFGLWVEGCTAGVKVQDAGCDAGFGVLRSGKGRTQDTVWEAGSRRSGLRLWLWGSLQGWRLRVEGLRCAAVLGGLGF